MSDECAENAHLLGKDLSGDVCLLFTNETEEKVMEFSKQYSYAGFAKAGSKASMTVKLDKGFDALKGYSHALEPYLRKLGLPTKLNN